MDTLRYLQHILPPLAFDLVKLALGLSVLFALFVPVEKLFSLHRKRTLRKDLPTDLAYYFASSLTPRLLFVPMSGIVWALHRVQPISLHVWMAELPLIVRGGAALIVAETGFYWGHRWMHRVPCLWRFHAVHHSAEEMDWLVNTRAHPVDILMIRCCGYAPLYILGLAQPTASRLDMIPLLISLLGSMWGYLIHANVKWRFGFLEHLVATPAFHHWHHANEGPRSNDRNYASLFPWLDRLFGSLHLPKSTHPGKYGIDEKLPKGIMAQFIAPFT